jgi:3-oxoacyl-[acyl-carrier protein] reductase
VLREIAAYAKSKTSGQKENHMDLGIQGRWALVGGASKGLGWGCAAALLAEGCNVVMVARGADALQASAMQLVASNPGSVLGYGLKSLENTGKVAVLPVAADITTAQGRDAVFSVPGGPGKNFDIVVTNAGGPPPGDFRHWGRDEWLAALDANMLTPIELIKATVDGMASRGFGRIINITSSAVKAPIDILGLSNGARSGLSGFVAGVARSGLAGKGVTINNLLPGTFDTDRLNANFATVAKSTGKSAEEVKAARIAGQPAKRLGTPEEFGKTCAFLCSVHAGYINGQNILMDGGNFPGTF